ncbi:MAG: fumarate hydratase, partial [Planctomycetaceae bacterium]
MTGLNYQLVQEVAKELYIRALKVLPPDVKEALRKAHARETKPTAKTILETILKSIEVSDTQDMLICQDTGLPVYMVKIGGRSAVDGSKLRAALAEGAQRATLEYPFR